MAEEIFGTRLGTMRLVTSDSGVSSLTFEDSETTKANALAKRIQKHFEGQIQDFSDVLIDDSNLSDFASSVYREARKIPSGHTKTYGELAKAVGKPRGAQAVGGTMGRNPVLLLIPCHRVLGSAGNLGGFSAPGGVLTKQRMLACEGWGTESLWDEGAMEEASQHLRKCRKLGPIVEAVGPCPLTPLYPETPFGALARAVLYQQLATKAAQAIEARVKKLGSGSFPTAEELHHLPEVALQEAGVSGPKRGTLKRLAQSTLDGDLNPDELKLLPNHDVESQVSEIKGLGAWSARMFLLFHLGRRDIFPVKDLGIRKGMQRLYDLEELPGPEWMIKKSKSWAPYRSLASWYLWRSLELS